MTKEYEVKIYKNAHKLCFIPETLSVVYFIGLMLFLIFGSGVAEFASVLLPVQPLVGYLLISGLKASVVLTIFSVMILLIKISTLFLIVLKKVKIAAYIILFLQVIDFLSVFFIMNSPDIYNTVSPYICMVLELGLILLSVFYFMALKKQGQLVNG